MPQAKLFVKLIAHTPQPENAVAMAAKLCYSGAHIEDHQTAVSGADNAAFLQKLVDMGHASPIEHVSFTFGAEGVSRVLLAQLTRHRIASFSVQSQRYVGQTGEGLCYVVPPAIAGLGGDHAQEYERQMEQIRAWYDEWCRLLGKGESGNEDARFVLPGATETRLMMTMNARELLHFFRLRCCMRAQWEIRAMAWAMLGHCLATAPALFAAAGPSCRQGACQEGKMSCGKMAAVCGCLDGLARFVELHKNGEDFAARLSEWASANARL